MSKRKEGGWHAQLRAPCACPVACSSALRSTRLTPKPLTLLPQTVGNLNQTLERITDISKTCFRNDFQKNSIQKWTAGMVSTKKGHWEGILGITS